MGTTNSSICNWQLIDDAKKILSDGNHTSNAVNNLLLDLRSRFNLNAIVVRQRISRPFSLRIMYEHVKNCPTKRINQTITYSEEDWNKSVSEYKKGYYIYYFDENKAPISGVIAKYKPQCILQLPYFSKGVFLGTLDFIDFEQPHDWSEQDIIILSSLRDLIFEDLTKLDEDKESKSSEYDKDYITGMNRYETFIENLDRAIPSCTIGNNAILVVYSDIHHFKLINEGYGYRKGDELLREYARQLQSGRTYIDACRVHSDNFIVAYQIQASDIDTTLRELEIEQKWLSLELQKCCPDSHIRICSGIYIIDNSDIDAATTAAYANMARKQSKQEKGLRSVLFSSDMIKDMKRRAYLNDELPKAIQNHNLVVYYQPKISCSSEKLFGAEALIRWQKDDGTFIYPDEFIPEFESNGNIVSLDYYVYEEVFRYQRYRLDHNLSVFPVSMNVSRLHLESNDILPYIRSLLDKYQIPPKYIEFELTENIYMQSIEPARKFISTCNDLGISVSMDDFGSGYSSLNMISSLPIDVLKIDKIFMKNETLSDNDKIVLNSVIDMAKRLNMTVLCEGVESKSQLNFLKDAGCDIIQGYYYGKPMSQTEFDKFVTSYV